MFSISYDPVISAGQIVSWAFTIFSVAGVYWRIRYDIKQLQLDGNSRDAKLIRISERLEDLPSAEDVRETKADLKDIRGNFMNFLQSQASYRRINSDK